MNTLATAAPSTASLRWSGHWIGHEPRAATGTPADFLTGGDVAREFSRSMFRTTFDLQELPTDAPARITADSRYVLWVNGHEVGRGPARSQPYRQRYDSYDLAPYLSVGGNVIAVLVTYYGRPMSFWQPAPAGSNTDAALVFEAQLGDRMLVSDNSWRVLRPAAWSLLAGTHAGEGVPVEIVDAREVPHRWREVDFDDSRVAAGSSDSRPSTPRASAKPGRRPIPSAASFLEASRSLSAAGWGQPACSIPLLVTPRHGQLTTPSPASPRHCSKDVVRTHTAELPASFDIAPGQVHHFSVDFGRIVAGFVELGLEAPAGTVVDMHYREKVFRPELAWSGEDPETGARYVAAGTDDQFAALEINGLRYLHLVVHADQASISHPEPARGARVPLSPHRWGVLPQRRSAAWTLSTGPASGLFSSTPSTPTPTARPESSAPGSATPSCIKWSTWRRTKTGV